MFSLLTPLRLRFHGWWTFCLTHWFLRWCLRFPQNQIPCHPSHHPRTPSLTGALKYPLPCPRYLKQSLESHLDTIRESDSSAKAKGKQPGSPIIKANFKPPFRGMSPRHKRTSSTYRCPESSVWGPNRRLMRKWDFGAPFAMAAAVATERTSPQEDLRGRG